MSLNFISSKSSRISSYVGTRAQTGDGFAKDISSGLTSLGGSLLWVVSPLRHQLTTALILGKCLSRRGKSVFKFSKGLCGLQ